MGKPANFIYTSFNYLERTVQLKNRRDMVEFFFLNVRGVSKDPEAASLYYSVGIRYNRTRRKENNTKVLQISKEDPKTKT